MNKFANYNAKNTSIYNIVFILNCSFYPQTSYKKVVNSHFQIILADKLSSKLKEHIAICKKDLYYVPKL